MAVPNQFGGPNSVTGLDAARWWWTWDSEVVKRILVDAANSQQYELPARRNDYDNVDASLLPFLAYELNALGYDTGGTEEANRRALKNAHELHQLLGTEAGFYSFLSSVRSTGFHTYTNSVPPGATGGARNWRVLIKVTPPIDRAGDARYLRMIQDRANKIFPVEILVLPIQILSTEDTTFYLAGASQTTIFVGWPDGI